MSDTDSFIEEVTEEVRRDRLYALLRRYGWIAILVILLIVGGAAYSEFRKAQARNAAEDLGDAMLAALEQNESADRAQALSDIAASTPSAQAVVDFLAAAALAEAEDPDAAAAALARVAQNGDLPLIYRQIARFKTLGLQAGTLGIEDRRAGYEALAQPGVALRPLAEEQLALLEVESGNTEAAIGRLNALINDSEVTPDLQQRAVQVIVALGGEPDLSALDVPEN